MHLPTNSPRLALLALALAGLGCGLTQSLPVTPIPEESLLLPTQGPSPSPTDVPASPTPLPQALIPAEAGFPGGPSIQLPTPDPAQFTRIERPEFGFALLARSDFQAIDLENGLSLVHASERRIFFTITRESYGLRAEVADEEIAQRLLDQVQALDPGARISIPYKAALGNIQNGRAADYVYALSGEALSGGITIGTTLLNQTYVVQWEAPQAVFHEYIESFVYQLESIELAS